MLSACMNWCVWILVALDLFASVPSVCLHVSVYFMRLTQVYPWDPYVIVTSFARFQIIFTCAWSVKWKKCNWEIQSWEWKLKRKPNLFYLLFSCSLFSCSFTWTVRLFFFKLSMVLLLALLLFRVLALCISLPFLCDLATISKKACMWVLTCMYWLYWP